MQEIKDHNVLITIKDIIGYMACWAVRQHPYGRPDKLFDVTDILSNSANNWDIGPPSLKMKYFDCWQAIEEWLYETLQDNPILTEWNTSRNKNTLVFTSVYNTANKEDDFIDIDALIRNVALSVWRDNNDVVEVSDISVNASL